MFYTNTSDFATLFFMINYNKLQKKKMRIFEIGIVGANDYYNVHTCDSYVWCP